MTQVKKETAKEVQPKATDTKDVTPKPETTTQPKAEVEPTDDKDETAKPVSTSDDKDENPKTPASTDSPAKEDDNSPASQVLNGGKDDLEGNPIEGIDEDLEESKDNLDTQKKAEAAIENGTSGLNPIELAEVQNGLVKDVNSDRPVYETASAAAAALKASGKL